MTRWKVALLLFVLALAVGGTGYWLGTVRAAPSVSAAASTDAPDDGRSADVPPVVAVKTVSIRRGALDQTLAAYGPIVAPPSEVAVVSAPFECRVDRLTVTTGQRVSAGDQLGEIAPSAETRLETAQAAAALAAAEKDADQTRQLYAHQLATSSELLQSEQALQQAQLKSDALRKSGAAGPTPLTAPSAGIVSKIDVQMGQTVPAAGPLVEIAASNHIVAQLGVDPEYAGSIHPGAPLVLTAIGATTIRVPAHVQQVAQTINPDTRLVDALIALPADSPLMLDSYVRGDLTVRSAVGLLVQRGAVLPGDDGNVLFTVKDGKAVKHLVNVLLETDEAVLVSAQGLAAGDRAVVVGNYELEDGMAVSDTPMETPTTQPADSAAEARS